MEYAQCDTQKNAFEILVDSLSQRLGPCSDARGINSEDVDANELQQLMEDYVSQETHWMKYFFPSSHHAYTRNLVDKGNGKSNLVGAHHFDVLPGCIVLIQAAYLSLVPW